jgi:hypothetical protein
MTNGFAVLGEGLNGPPLADTLAEVAAFFRRFVVVGDQEAEATALWVGHTYVCETANATPYLHFFSPEPGSGKSTALDVLSVLSRNAVQADNLTEAVLFRMIDKQHPTLLLDEVDAVFGKKNSDSTEGIRQVLNSGYRRGKQAWRCVPPGHDVVPFDVFCPKALAGLHELPGTLAHRAIPIAMQPPLPSDSWEDFDHEEVEGDAARLREALEGWAAGAEEALRDPRLKPTKLPGLDARANEIWRVLFRIADLAGGAWPERARETATALSGGDRRHRDTSSGVKLLQHIRQVFPDERMFCGALVLALNKLDEAPYGGWNGGAGMTTRELGKKLGAYGVIAKTVRIGEGRANGYERAQFEGAWARYLPSNRDSVTTRIVEPKIGETKPGQRADVTVPDKAANPDQKRDVTDVTVSEPGFDPISNEEFARLAVTAGDQLPDAEVRRLLERYRPDVIGRDDILTRDERRSIAFQFALYERVQGAHATDRMSRSFNELRTLPSAYGHPSHFEAPHERRD